MRGDLIPAGTGMEFYRKIKIPDEVIEGLGEAVWKASTPPSTRSSPSTSGRVSRRFRQSHNRIWKTESYVSHTRT
jgi:hypothetical protein